MAKRVRNHVTNETNATGMTSVSASGFAPPHEPVHASGDVVVGVRPTADDRVDVDLLHRLDREAEEQLDHAVAIEVRVRYPDLVAFTGCKAALVERDAQAIA